MWTFLTCVCDKSACLPFLSIPPNLPSPSLSSPLSHSFLPVSFCSRLSNCGCQLLQSLCCCCCGATPAKCPAQSPSLFSPPLCSFNTIAPPSWNYQWLHGLSLRHRDTPLCCIVPLTCRHRWRYCWGSLSECWHTVPKKEKKNSRERDESDSKHWLALSS